VRQLRRLVTGFLPRSPGSLLG